MFFSRHSTICKIRLSLYLLLLKWFLEMMVLSKGMFTWETLIIVGRSLRAWMAWYPSSFVPSDPWSLIQWWYPLLRHCVQWVAGHTSSFWNPWLFCTHTRTCVDYPSNGMRNPKRKTSTFLTAPASVVSCSSSRWSWLSSPGSPANTPSGCERAFPVYSRAGSAYCTLFWIHVPACPSGSSYPHFFSYWDGELQWYHSGRLADCWWLRRSSWGCLCLIHPQTPLAPPFSLTLIDTPWWSVWAQKSQPLHF